MDKKVLAGVVDAIVQGVKEQGGLEEAEARALVGIALKKLKEQIVARALPKDEPLREVS